MLETRRDGEIVSEYRMLDNVANTLNLSGFVLIEKGSNEAVGGVPTWQCPLTLMPASDLGSVFVSAESGLGYPVLRGIPMLRSLIKIAADRDRCLIILSSDSISI